MQPLVGELWTLVLYVVCNCCSTDVDCVHVHVCQGGLYTAEVCLHQEHDPRFSNTDLLQPRTQSKQQFHNLFYNKSCVYYVKILFLRHCYLDCTKTRQPTKMMLCKRFSGSLH